MVEGAKGYKGVTVESLNLPEGIDAAVRELVKGGPTPGIDNDSEFQLVRDTLGHAVKTVIDVQQRVKRVQMYMSATSVEKAAVYKVPKVGGRRAFRKGDSVYVYTVEKTLGRRDRLKRKKIESDGKESVEQTLMNCGRTYIESISHMAVDDSGIYVMFGNGRVGKLIQNDAEGRLEIKLMMFGGSWMTARRLFVYRGHVAALVSRGSRSRIRLLHKEEISKGVYCKS